MARAQHGACRVLGSSQVGSSLISQESEWPGQGRMALRPGGWSCPDVSYGDRLGVQGVFMWRRLQGDLRASFSAQRGSKGAGEGFWTRAWSARTRGNGFELPEGRVRRDIGLPSHTLLGRKSTFLALRGAGTASIPPKLQTWLEWRHLTVPSLPQPLSGLSPGDDGRINLADAGGPREMGAACQGSLGAQWLCLGDAAGGGAACRVSRGRYRRRVPEPGAVPDAPRPRPGARPGPSPAEAPAVGAAAGLRSRHRSRRPHGAPDGAAGPARELSPERPRYRIPAETGHPSLRAGHSPPDPREWVFSPLQPPGPGILPRSAPHPRSRQSPRYPGAGHYPIPGPRIRPRHRLPLSSPPRGWCGFFSRPSAVGKGWRGQEHPSRVPPTLRGGLGWAPGLFLGGDVSP